MITPKRRMLNAYRGLFSDRYPVAPEFWYYYPARILGVDMIQFEREIPFWQALKAAFGKFGTEGWGTVRCALDIPAPPDCRETFIKLNGGQYELRREQVFTGRRFQEKLRYDVHEPSWRVEYPVKNPADEFDAYFRMCIQNDFALKPEKALEAYAGAGESFLLECSIGGQFIDFVANAMGFENAIAYIAAEPAALESYRRRYSDYLAALAGRLAAELPFESYFIGCAYSCASLIGPHLWRRWDLPVVKAVVQAVHRHGKLVHLHYHGKSMDNAADLAATGVDCVCPFERPPGGDVEGLAGLKTIRCRIGEHVTFNGNVHTVETLIRGRPADVRREVGEILEAFAGSPRLIIGTGDQVGRETPEENIAAMVASISKHPQDS